MDVHQVIATLSTKGLIAFANVLSGDITNAYGDRAKRDACEVYFDIACKALEARGIVVSDHVVCPEE